MLKFILGRAGTGKTSRLIGRMREVLENGGKAILLVPEQGSFESERMVLQSLGSRLCLGVQVLSFTRLCDSIFRAYGGMAGVTVTRTARYLLMSLAVRQLQDDLRVYRKSCNNPAFLQTLVEVCSEFKSAGLTPERLGQVAKGSGEGPLREKLDDLSSLYGAYQAMLSRGYIDPEDDLIRASELLRGRDYFAGMDVFVDGFTTFTAAEVELLAQILEQARDVQVAVTADGEEASEDEVGMFSAAQDTVRKLIRRARVAGVAVSGHEILREPLRYKNGELAHVARHLFSPYPEKYEDEPVFTHIYEASEPYQEIEYVADQILRLVREEGYRYGEIAVVARNTEPYLRAFESAFARRELPYFVDSVRDVENMPLAGGLAAAIEAVRSGFDGESVLLYAKSPISGLAPEQVAELENYCYCWGVRGSIWKGELRNNPRGLTGTLTESDMAALIRVNRARESIIEPLSRLEDCFRDCDGKAFARAIFQFLEDVNAARRLMDFARSLPDVERETFLDESAQLWDTLMDILDVFGTVLGGVKMPAARFCELLRLSLSTAEVGLTPQTLDEVLVGSAGRIRPGERRAVFIVGAVEGEFPAPASTAGVFTDDERRRMIELGAEIGPPALRRAVQEKYYAYHALTIASERLFVCSHRALANGSGTVPSVIIAQLRELFPRIQNDGYDAFELTPAGLPGFDLLARHFREDSPRTAALFRHFADSRAPLLERMEKSALKPPHQIRDAQAAKALFGGDMALSPTRVERYYRCPFAYFAGDGLGFRPRGRVEFSPLESGSVIHHLLQVMVQRHGSGLFSLPEDRLIRELREVISQYLEERIRQREVLPTRFRYLFHRLEESLARLLRNLGTELAQSEYRPAAFELPINRREGVPPLELKTVDGTSVLVEGIVDRVDVMEKSGKRYVRVIDYKSGGKDFRLDDVLYGLNLQMLLYLFTVAENGDGPLEDAIPAGILYMPVLSGYVTAERDTPEAEIALERQKRWRMSGLLLDDEESLRGMESELRGIFIPARVNKDGSLDKKSSLAGKAEMGRLARKVKELISKMAQSLCAGDIRALPANTGGFSPCSTCDYSAMCGFEQGDAVREIVRMDASAVFKQLESEQQD